MFLSVAQDLRDEGAVAILHATVFGIAPTSEDADVKFSYQLFEEDQTEVASVSVDQVCVPLQRCFPLAK